MGKTKYGVAPGITADGVDCIENWEGSVSDYVARQEGARYETHIHGSVTGGQLAWGDNNEQSIRSNGFDVEGVARLMQAIVQALPLLELNTHESEEVVALARLVQSQSAEDHPDRSWIKATLDRIAGALGKAGDVALGIVLQALIKEAAQSIGVPAGQN